MKKVIKAILLSIIFYIIITAGCVINAASANISASKNSVEVGDSVSIYVNYTAAAWNLKIRGDGITNTNIADVTEDTENASNLETLNLDTSRPGTYVIKLTGDITDGTTEVTTQINKTVSVIVKEKVVQNNTENNQNNGTEENKQNLPVNNNTSTNTTEDIKPIENSSSQVPVQTTPQNQNVVQNNNKNTSLNNSQTVTSNVISNNITNAEKKSTSEEKDDKDKNEKEEELNELKEESVEKINEDEEVEEKNTIVNDKVTRKVDSTYQDNIRDKEEIARKKAILEARQVWILIGIMALIVIIIISSIMIIKIK